MEKKIERANVGGLIFSCPAGTYRSVEAWFEAKAPANSLVYDSPAQLLAAGISVVDGRKMDGVYTKAKLKPPATSTITVPAWCIKGPNGKTLNRQVKLADLEGLKPAFYPTFVYFEQDSIHQQRKAGIGTARPSKVSASKAKDESKSKVSPD